MTTALLPVAPPAVAIEEGARAAEEFELDLTVTRDLELGYSPRRCTTNDGCAGSCASACASS